MLGELRLCWKYVFGGLELGCWARHGALTACGREGCSRWWAAGGAPSFRGPHAHSSSMRRTR